MALEFLFRSKTLYKVLNLLVSNKKKSFFIREISRKINSDVAIVHRELGRLEKEGIVISETRGKNKYFKINQKGEDYKKLALIFENQGSSNLNKKFIVAYGEPWATPLAMSVNMNAFPELRRNDKRFINADVGDTVGIFHGTDFQFGVEMDKMKKVSREINRNLFKKGFIDSNKKIIEELSIKMIVAIRKLASLKEVNKDFVSKLDKLFDQGIELCQLGYVGSLADFPDVSLSKKMKQIVCKRIKKEKSEMTDQQLINILSAPPKLSLTTDRELEILKISKNFLGNKASKMRVSKKLKKKLLEYYTSFYWTDFGQIGFEKDSNQVNKEITDILKNYNKNKIEKRIDEIKKYEEITIEKKKKLSKKFKINREEFNLFNSAGTLAYLKGLRQEILGGINSQLRILIESIEKKHNINKKYLWQASFDELLYIFHNGPKNNIEKELKEREKMAIWIFKDEVRSEKILSGKLAENFFKKRVEEEQKEIDQKESFHGMTAYLGKVRAQVVIVNSDFDLKRVKEGDILVAQQTMPIMVPAMKKAAGFLTDIGGITCHAAIMAREFKKPCIVGTKIATKILKDGDFVELDADKGTVKIIKLN
jgi:phosphohistidine swiveling domain-containing protein/predicted transcriptional regulator